MNQAKTQRAMKAKCCEACGQSYTPRSGRQMFCSEACGLGRREQKVATACDCCGITIMREPSAGKRWPRTYCSILCRSYDLHGPRFSEIPARHAAATPKPKSDNRSALRRAVEDGKPADVLVAVRARCVVKNSSGCWEWQGRLRDGYPTAVLGKRYALVHRLSLEASLGAPLGDQPAHHICANTACVNPDHLQPVSHRENVAEMLARNYMERRIVALEEALRTLNPSHHLLDEVSISRAS